MVGAIHRADTQIWANTVMNYSSVRRMLADIRRIYCKMMVIGDRYLGRPCDAIWRSPLFNTVCKSVHARHSLATIFNPGFCSPVKERRTWQESNTMQLTASEKMCQSFDASGIKEIFPLLGYGMVGWYGACIHKIAWALNIPR